MLSRVLPAAWHRHAHVLRRSAEFLWMPLEHALTLQAPASESDLELWDHSYAFLLVAGASLEAILKAAAIHAQMNVDGLRQVLKKGDTELQGWVTTHDLVSLAKRAKIDLAPDEEDQLARFEKYVTWAGSYPTPKEIKDSSPVDEIRFHYRVSNLDHVWFERLFFKAEHAYETLRISMDRSRRRAKVKPAMS